jgi:hypothetical protein
VSSDVVDFSVVPSEGVSSDIVDVSVFPSEGVSSDVVHTFKRNNRKVDNIR